MDGHVWRVPTLLGLTACSALLLFAAAVVGSIITRRRPSALYKVGTGAVLVLLAIVTAVVVRATATRIARSLGVDVTDVNPGPLGYLAPVMFAAFAFAVGQRILGDAWAGRRALLFYGWLLGFTVANVVNRCSPGWCTTVGFPFTWYAWSDATLTFGDGSFGNFIDVFGKAVSAVLNLFTFVAVTIVLMRVRIRGRPA